jgi:hypothetical protein
MCDYRVKKTSCHSPSVIAQCKSGHVLWCDELFTSECVTKFVYVLQGMLQSIRAVVIKCSKLVLLLFVIISNQVQFK